MVYTETGKFKRYVRNRKGKEVVQVGVSGLSVNSQFDDDDEIIILRKTDFTQLENTVSTQVEKIQDLENQLNQSKDTTTENPKHYNKVITLQEEINNRNELLFNTQNTINTIINEAVSNYNQLGTEVTQANNDTKNNIIGLISDLQKDINSILEYSKEIPNQVNGINSSIDNVSWFKWIRSKNDFKIVLDMDKLTELQVKLIEFTSQDIVHLANNMVTPMEIQVSKLEGLTNEDLDLSNLYISTKDNDNTTEIPAKKLQ